LASLFGPLALASVPAILGFVSEAAFVRGKFALSAHLAAALHRSPPALFMVAVLALNWPGAVEAWTGQSASFTDWPEPALLLALLPFIAFQLLAIDARARLKDARPEHRAQERGFQARLFFSAMVPFLLYLGAVLLVGWERSVRARVDGVDLYRVTFSCGVLVLFVISMPSILRNTWRTEPLKPGSQRELLENLAARAGFRCRDLLVWHTGHRMANAAIVGMTPRTRVVLLSDSLLSMLPQRELGAVFAHEIAHALRHHVIIFLLWTLAFFMGAELSVGWISTWVRSQGESWMPAPAWFGSGLALTLAVGWYLGFGWLSRRFELEADLKGVELTDDPAALVSALEQVGGRYREAGGWRHFSTAERVAFVERAHWDQEQGRRLRFALRRWGVLSVVLVLVFGSLQLAELVDNYPWQMAQVELREGQPEAAQARLQAAGEGEGWLGDMIAADLAARGRRGGLESYGLRALERGDDVLAGQCLDLLILRGREDLTGVRAALNGSPGEGFKGLDLPPDWARAVASWAKLEEGRARAAPIK
jgi:Zn-dependent protease with chaperone function